MFSSYRVVGSLLIGLRHGFGSRFLQPVFMLLRVVGILWLAPGHWFVSPPGVAFGEALSRRLIICPRSARVTG